MLTPCDLHKRTRWFVVILSFSGFQGGSTGSNPVGGAGNASSGRSPRPDHGLRLNVSSLVQIHTTGSHVSRRVIQLPRSKALRF
jgi:hypothetical protein